MNLNLQEKTAHEVTHPNPMLTRDHTVKFLSPTFLGDAQQNAAWRTPPFKHVLREWWRVAYAAEHGFRNDVAGMRQQEAVLFGHAWLENEPAQQSQVRIRLDQWKTGTLTSWSATGNTDHKDVGKPVGSDLYLGYGPLKFGQGGTALKSNAAIQAGESALLRVAAPASEMPVLEQALLLADRYGAVGGRSRNGWGALELTPLHAASVAPLTVPLRQWQNCLDRDWPHAIGADEKGPLIWQTPVLADWKAAMKRLAEIKIKLRTNFVLTTGMNASRTEERHWLSYPVTHHSVAAWGNNARLPNSLRFKLRHTQAGLVGLIVHVPHLPPPSFQPTKSVIERVWQQVHTFLDDPTQALKRIQE